jgi:hypothetical protein
VFMMSFWILYMSQGSTLCAYAYAIILDLVCLMRYINLYYKRLMNEKKLYI